MSLKVLIPLPDKDFDTTETSVPWQILTQNDVEVVFATEHGNVAACDPLLLTGVIFGALGADAEAKSFYNQMIDTENFKNPVTYKDLVATDYDGIILPGGHAKGVRQILESEDLRAFLLSFWRLQRPVAAICHGVIALTRCIDPETGKSIIHERKTTCLPSYMEKLAFGLTFWWRGRYYRTYDEYVQDEVCKALADKQQFQRGPTTIGKRGTATDDKAAFIVQDKNYLSARWPGDAYLFARRFLAMLTEGGDDDEHTTTAATTTTTATRTESEDVHDE